MRHAFRLGSLVCLFVLPVLGSGCVGPGSASLPTELSAAEKARVRNAHLPLIIAVERYHYPAYSDALLAALQQTKLFDHVDFRDRLQKPPSLIAEVEQPVAGNPVIPIRTLFSLGIIPTTFGENHGYVFSLHSPSNENEKKVIEGTTFRSLKDETQKVMIDYRYCAKTTLGWVALFKACSRDEVMFSPESHQRFRDAFTSAILEHSEKLRGLADQERK
jgi:hypothetical protein